MMRIFTLPPVARPPVAVITRHWFEIDLVDASMEHGCRVEVRELVRQPHRGTESAAQVVTLDKPLWRADLFDRLTDAPGTYGVAHFHPSFDGVEPSPRVFDDVLSADPWGWLDAQLRAWADPATTNDIVANARTFAPERCTSVERCHELTEDVQHAVRLMMRGLQQPDRLDRDRTALWAGP
jgi:hypothetical protein